MRKKEIDKKVTIKEKKSQVKARYLSELKEMIRQVNLLPPEFQLKNLNYELELQRQSLREKTGDPHATPSITEALKVCLEGTTKEFQQYLEEVAAKNASLFPAKQHMVVVYNVQAKANEYIRLYGLRIEMRLLVERLERERKEEITPEYWLNFSLPIYATVFRGKDGKLRGSGLIGLIGKVDDSRLRSCIICQRIFWAENKNSFTHSETCRNALRQRKHREKNKEEINRKRRERYQSKKEQKQGKERSKNKNGTL